MSAPQKNGFTMIVISRSTVMGWQPYLARSQKKRRCSAYAHYALHIPLAPWHLGGSPYWAPHTCRDGEIETEMEIEIGRYRSLHTTSASPPQEALGVLYFQLTINSGVKQEQVAISYSPVVVQL